MRSKGIETPPSEPALGASDPRLTEFVATIRRRSVGVKRGGLEPNGSGLMTGLGNRICILLRSH